MQRRCFNAASVSGSALASSLVTRAQCIQLDHPLRSSPTLLFRSPVFDGSYLIQLPHWFKRWGVIQDSRGACTWILLASTAKEYDHETAPWVNEAGVVHH